MLAAKRRSGTHARRALEELIGSYWYPVYAFMRRQGQARQEAEDLAQEFFTRLLEKNYLKQVDQARGRFRSFLLASLKHFLSNERDKARALKRGGGVRVVRLDAALAEARYAVEPVDAMTPERLFDRRWALSVLEQVLERLRLEHSRVGKAAMFEKLKDSLMCASGGIGYARLAGELDMSEGAVKVAVHRMRRRYRDLLREEIAQTVDGSDQVDEEIRYLMNCL